MAPPADPQLEAYRSRMGAIGASPQLVRAEAGGAIRLAIADFQAFEGGFQAHPYLMLNMCLNRTGQLRRVGTLARVEGALRPGAVGLALPGDEASGFWPDARMLGVAIDLQALKARGVLQVEPETLINAASRLHSDPLITAVMTAMWRDAEAHGLSSAFFEHGLSLVLRRLADAPGPKAAPRRVIPPLGRGELGRVLELIEARLAGDLGVGEMASAVSMDASTFTRAFRAATGLPPFAYLTRRRMARAQALLKRGRSVTHTALAVGYANPSKFAAAFVRTHGVTPSQWRRGQGVTPG